ncbi:hypothetical protein WME73_20695 [Sorangium sp. So ce302]|uniref:hypothetical protein n=1 Tax=unclassified Sorangium TaxID=2621164 RepID=UPI003F62DD97
MKSSPQGDSLDVPTHANAGFFLLFTCVCFAIYSMVAHAIAIRVWRERRALSVAAIWVPCVLGVLTGGVRGLM